MFSWFTPHKEKRNIIIKGKEITVNITTENRADARVSLTKKGLNIRLPQILSKREERTTN